MRTWLYWGMFWLMVTPSVGVTISGLFNYPDYLGTTHLGLTFGRLRPIHVNGVIFGGGRHEVDVAVDVRPLPMTELADG